MLTQLSYYSILGLPLIVYGGIFTLLMALITATVAYLGQKGKIKNHYRWHVILARITIIFALGHGLLGILAYL